MGQKDLPLASGKEHLKAFERLGWEYVRTAKSAHFILGKDGVDCKMSIPDHKEVKRALLQKQLKLAEIEEELYVASFNKNLDPA